MQLHNYPLGDIVTQYTNLYNTMIYIIDTTGIIQFASSPDVIGMDISMLSCDADIDAFTPDSLDSELVNKTSQNSGTAYMNHILENSHIIGTIAVEDEKNRAMEISSVLKICIEALISSKLQALNPASKATDFNNTHSYIINSLFSETQSKQYILTLLHKMELDESLLRVTICIELTFKVNEYFNINLNLGYQSSIENTRQEIISIIKSNKYFNQQDLCSFYEDDKIVILKSFIKNNDISRIYMALDKICEEIENDLSPFTFLDFKMAYGNLCSDMFNLKKSYIEAREIIAIGKVKNPSLRFYNINIIMIDNICRFLHPQIINKIIHPTLKKLTNEAGELQYELLSCCEAFVDSCMNFTEASKKVYLHRNTINLRLTKLKDITGLDPLNSFNDALIVKLLAVYVQYNKELYHHS